MISFQFLAAPIQPGHAHAEIELLYLLRGKLRLQVGGNEYELRPDDFLIINSGTVHAYSSDADLLLGEFHIQPDKLSEALGRSDLRFRCNSALSDAPEQYEPVRELMQEIFTRFRRDQSGDVLRLYSLYYRLLQMLVANFLSSEQTVSEPAVPVSSRTEEITEYIRLNYDKPIRLSDLAEQLHLSVAYLSKYIKKNLGMSFLDYLSRIRLSHAVSALIHSSDSVARISMDTGFANLAAFNKAFREAYHTTPSAYRQQNRSGALQLSAERLPPRLSADDGPAEAGSSPQREETPSPIFRTVSVPNAAPEPMNRDRETMMNLGAAADLLRADVQQQALFLCQRLGITYLRIWDLYSAQMLLDRPAADGSYSFQRLDRVLDFLLSNGIRPYLELGDKVRQVFLQNPRSLTDRPPNRRFSDPEEFFLLLSQLARHLLLRYGRTELERWYFEYWKDEAEYEETEDSEQAYLDRFDRVWDILSGISPRLRLGGGGFSLRFGEEPLARVLSLWPAHRAKPAFLSLYCYPALDQSDRAAVLKNQLVNPNSIRATLECVRRLLQGSELERTPLHVTEWNISVNNRSPLNDSYFKGAYMVKNLLDSAGQAELMGYWLATDLYAEGPDAPLPLFGGCGLISRDGIPKPAWYALEFLSQLGTERCAQGENYIVTRDDAGAWRILCHNYKPFNYRYYLYEENLVPMEELEALLSDTAELNLLFELPAAEGQQFHVKISRIGRDAADLLAAWQRGGSVQQPGPEELADLARASVPQTSLNSLSPKGDLLQFQARLSYNETLLIVLTPQA